MPAFTDSPLQPDSSKISPTSFLSGTSLQQDKQKASRASTQKVRTGCITCKKRHVKCDEAKPYCGNCLRSRGHCEGYRYASVTVKKHPAFVQIFWDSKESKPVARRVPQPHAQRQSQLQRTQHPLRTDPAIFNFRNDTDFLYFQEFVELAQSRWTSAVSTGDLWVTTLPQLARRNETLRSAAIAIGALSMWHRQSASGSLRLMSAPQASVAASNPHYIHALDYYCRSLKLQCQHPSVQDALFLSMLLLFFERLRGDMQAALEHVNHGLALLFAVLTDEESDCLVTSLAPSPRALLSAVADVFTDLATQARTVLRGRVDSGPPLPNLAKSLIRKKQTMESFMVLLSKLPRPSSFSSYPVVSSSVDIVPPAVFDTLDEFECFWAAVGRGQTAMNPIMVEIMQSSGVVGSTDEAVIDNFYHEVLGGSEVRKMSEIFQRAMRAIDAAFQPLFDQVIMSDTDSLAYLKAVHLRLQFLGAYIFNDPPQFLNIESLQARTPLFREYLSLAQVALRANRREMVNPAHQLSLQCGLAWYLLIISFFSRDPLVRGEAVWMLSDYPNQDGLWDTRSLHALALRNCIVERENSMEGTPTEQWRRLWRREFVFEDGGDRIVFRYLKRDQASGQWALVEEAGEFQDGTDDVMWTRQPLTGSGGLLMADLYTSVHGME